MKNNGQVSSKKENKRVGANFYFWGMNFVFTSLWIVCVWVNMEFISSTQLVITIAGLLITSIITSKFILKKKYSAGALCCKKEKKDYDDHYKNAKSHQNGGQFY